MACGPWARRRARPRTLRSPPPSGLVWLAIWTGTKQTAGVRGARPMIVGVPREIKIGEQRVALTPAGARAFAEAGHRVLVEPGAGQGSGIRDEDYLRAGAALAGIEALWREAELILKVKEPQLAEVRRLRRDQTLFTYLHLAPARDLTRALQAQGGIAI